MRTLLTKFVDVRDGETSRALLMFSYIFLIICCLLIIKPVRNSLFLARFGAAQLPYAFILVAGIAGIVSSIYARYASRVRLDLLMKASTLIILSNLAFFWGLLYIDYEGGWFIYAFYAWSAIFAAITTSQFWILANYVFDAREAKRLFGFIGAGAISGGIFGGYLTSYLAPIIGTENLLFLCMAFLIVCMIILQRVWKERATSGKSETTRQRHQTRSNASGNALKLLLGSRHTAYLAAIVAVSVTVANLVDFQYNDIIDKSISNPDEVTAFLGLWLSNLSLISLGIQLFLTNRVLKTFGVGATLFFLPIGILVGAVAIFFNPVLWSAIAVKIADGSLKQSINKAGLELLYLPVPSNIKPQIKSFIDVFVDSLSTGFSGVLLIICTTFLGFQVGELSILTIALIGVWIFLIIRIRSEYTQAFRIAIEKRTINLAEQAVNLDDASMFENLLEILGSDNKRQILYVLDLLENVTHPSFVPYLRKLLSHEDAEIREHALNLIMGYSGNDFQEEVTPLLKGENQKLRTLALDYLFHRADNKPAFLQEYFDHTDYHLRASALLCLASSYNDIPELHNKFNIEEMIHSLLNKSTELKLNSREKAFTKSHIAMAIGLAKQTKLNPYLHQLLKDDTSEVLAATARSIGKTRDPEFISELLELLDRKQVKQFAREALASYGEPIIDKLATVLDDQNVRRSVRLVIPRVVASIGVQKSVDVLTAQLGKSDLFLRYRIIKSLSSLRQNFPLLKFNDNAIEKYILQECQSYIQMLNVLNAQHNAGMEKVKSSNGKQERINNARALLIKALEEKLDNNLERVFRLLGLRYEQRDMLNAYLGILSDKQDLRANAVEFLDNILESSLKRYIIPIVENAELSKLLEVASMQLKITLADEAECLRDLLHHNDTWLQACAVYLIGQLGYESHLSDIEKLKNHHDSVLNEAVSQTISLLQATR
ncbi:MAG: Npt1/Npt2 family nucleotide transporter [Calditrichia bacterium]